MEKKHSWGVRLAAGWMRLRAFLPLGYHYRWARVVAWVARDVLHYREEVVLTNLARSFPGKKYGELAEIKDRFYQHFGEIFAEAAWFGGCRGDKGRKKLKDSHLVEIDNSAEFNAFFDRCSSVMLLNSHAGNWEITGGVAQYDYGPESARHWDYPEVVVLYKRLKSGFWDQVIGVNRCAPVLDRDYDGYVESASILRYAVSHRREKKLYIFNTDQHPYRGVQRCEVGMFLSQPTEAMTGGAALACKLDMGVAYMRWKQVERGHYRMTFVPLCDHASETAPEEIMKQYYAHLEQDIREQPWNYLWSHKRWK
ncbi:MAG: lysophospholipid acyltransferase family protein [Bacteroidales bacterium]|nr:lysophospholipid acyltransferase family protein [Bacteroidales bacterium]